MWIFKFFGEPVEGLETLWWHTTFIKYGVREAECVLPPPSKSMCASVALYCDGRCINRYSNSSLVKAMIMIRPSPGQRLYILSVKEHIESEHLTICRGPIKKHTTMEILFEFLGGCSLRSLRRNLSTKTIRTYGNAIIGTISLPQTLYFKTSSWVVIEERDREKNHWA